MDKNDYLISIILPVYNGEKYICQCIESCLLQTYKNWELIIVNDCSTDDTSSILDEYLHLDSRIQVINNKSNHKLPKSLNIGHEKSSGSLITWISHDNKFHKDFLYEMSGFLFENNVDIVYSNYCVINSSEDYCEVRSLEQVDQILIGNPVQASFLYRKDVYIALDGYKENLFLVEDFDFWLRASLKFKILHTTKVLYDFRKHDNSLTSSIYNDIYRFNQFVKALILSYSGLNDKVFSLSTAIILTMIQVNKIGNKYSLPLHCLINMGSSLKEIHHYCKITGYDYNFYLQKVPFAIRRLILNGTLKLSFTSVMYLVFFQPKWCVYKFYDVKQLLKAYVK